MSHTCKDHAGGSFFIDITMIKSVGFYLLKNMNLGYKNHRHKI